MSLCALYTSCTRAATAETKGSRELVEAEILQHQRTSRGGMESTGFSRSSSDLHSALITISFRHTMSNLTNNLHKASL